MRKKAVKSVVSRTEYWKAVRDVVARLGSNHYSHTYIRECANGIKSVNESTMAKIKKAMDTVPYLPVNRRSHHEGA